MEPPTAAPTSSPLILSMGELPEYYSLHRLMPRLISVIRNRAAGGSYPHGCLALTPPHILLYSVTPIIILSPDTR